MNATPEPRARVTALELFLDRGAIALPRLASILVGSDAIRVAAMAAHRWPTGIPSIAHQVAETAKTLINVDLGKVLVDGWRTYRDIVAAARATAASPGTVKEVKLVSHDVGATYRPYVEIIVAGSRVATIQFELRLILTIDGLIAIVRNGSIVAAQVARCGYQAALACEHVTAAEHNGVLDPGFAIELGSGIQLAKP